MIRNVSNVLQIVLIAITIKHIVPNMLVDLIEVIEYVKTNNCIPCGFICQKCNSSYELYQWIDGYYSKYGICIKCLLKCKRCESFDIYKECDDT